jgi:predicted enzyme related to lactoylglutathione lyase
MPNVDAHYGWLIFKLPPAELGIHPAGEASSDGHHELYFMCDDVAATVAELQAKGVEFTTGIEQAGFGLMTRLRVPGAGEIGLYQPLHPVAYGLDD